MPPSSRQLVADRQHLPVGSFWVWRRGLAPSVRYECTLLRPALAAPPDPLRILTTLAPT
jgi:hypothetical protein